MVGAAFARGARRAQHDNLGWPVLRVGEVRAPAVLELRRLTRALEAAETRRWIEHA